MVSALRVWVALILFLAAMPVTGQGWAWQEAPAQTLYGVVRPPGSGVPVPESLGVSWERVTFEWAALQPDGPDDWVEETIDPALLAGARSAGREVVGLITGTPDWAALGLPAESARAGAIPRGLALAPDDPGNLWAAFVARLAETFGPLGVTRWIIYDTPDVRRGEGRVQFAGSEADYARLLVVARAALDSVDPRAVVIAGAVEGWADVAAGRDPYLARLVRALAAQLEPLPFDAVVVRATAGTQDIWDRLAEARAILDAAGYGSVALWLEAGMVADPAALLGVSTQQQADLIAQAVAISRAAGVERFAAYMLADSADGTAWGLVAADDTPRPALEAYQTVIELLGAAATIQYRGHLAADVILAEGAKSLVVMAWARGESAVELRVTSPAVGEAGTLISPGGRRVTVQSGPEEWPAGYAVALAPPQRDAFGFLTVAGAPQVLMVEMEQPGSAFFRVVWLVVEGTYIRLR